MATDPEKTGQKAYEQASREREAGISFNREQPDFNTPNLNTGGKTQVSLPGGRQRSKGMDFGGTRAGLAAVRRKLFGQKEIDKQLDEAAKAGAIALGPTAMLSQTASEPDIFDDEDLASEVLDTSSRTASIGPTFQMNSALS